MSQLPDKYRAIVVRETKNGYSKKVESLPLDHLPDNDVLIHVYYSSLNYKDALSASGQKGITTAYPHTPGIDAAGIVARSTDKRYREGDPVLVTSYDLGMDTPGGFGQYICVPGNWVIPIPKGLTMKESMVIGTAGFTAAYGIMKITQSGIKTGDGPVVVTGATGGVGSFGIALLAQIGYHVVAITGKKEKHVFLTELGAAEIMEREYVTDHSNKQLLKGTWAAALDTVGGVILDTLIRQTRHNGVVACCGNVLGHTLKTSIYPFILRGVSLMGIDSGITLMPKRLEIWNKMSNQWKPDKLDQLYREVDLESLADEIDTILRGDQTGRVIVNLRG